MKWTVHRKLYCVLLKNQNQHSTYLWNSAVPNASQTHIKVICSDSGLILFTHHASYKLPYPPKLTKKYFLSHRTKKPIWKNDKNLCSEKTLENHFHIHYKQLWCPYTAKAVQGKKKKGSFSALSRNSK